MSTMTTTKKVCRCAIRSEEIGFNRLTRTRRKDVHEAKK